MPVPPILTPMPNAKYRDLHDERVALARLRLHLLMARLRSGLRRTLEVAADRKKVSQFTSYITDELAFIMQHIGFIHMEGYRIAIPYGLQDLANQLLNFNAVAFATELSWQKDLNQDFNAISDKLILDTTDNYFYWWDPDFEIPAGGGSVPGHVILPHFFAYYNAVIEKKYQTSVTGQPHLIPFLDTAEDVPGLRAPPLQRSSAPAMAKATAGGGSSLCENCERTREVVVGALKKLHTAQANTAMHIREGEEAAFRSCDAINGYTALEKISDVCDPFADGKDLPKQFQKLHPKHESPDSYQPLFDFNLLRAARDPYLVSVKNPAAKEKNGEAHNEGDPATINDVTYRLLCFKQNWPVGRMPLIAGELKQGQRSGDGGSQNGSGDGGSDIGSGDGASDFIVGDGESEAGVSHTTSIPSEFERLVEDEEKEDENIAEDESDEADQEYIPELEDEMVDDDGFIID